MTQDLSEILKERGARYGKFADHARITQEIKQVFRDHTPGGVMRHGEHVAFFEADQVEALDMIAHKLGRILAGDPNYADSWVDIAGYAQLVANRLLEEGEQ